MAGKSLSFKEGPVEVDTDVALGSYLDNLQIQQDMQRQLAVEVGAGDAAKKPKGKKVKGGGTNDWTHAKRLEREVAELTKAVKQLETELSSKTTECSTLKVDIDEQGQKMSEIVAEAHKREKNLLAALEVSREENTMIVDELKHQILLLQLDNTGLQDKLTIYDTPEVELHNHELRAELAALQEERMQERGRQNLIREQQRKAVAQLKFAPTAAGQGG